jgi:drug/metabolite transporter (DMT)-like permease
MTRTYPQSYKATTRGYSLLLIGTTLWSSSAVFISFLTRRFQLPSMVLAFWRDVFVSVALMIALAITSPGLLHVNRRHIPFLCFYGLVLAGFNMLFTRSVAVNGAAIATVLTYSSPAFTAIAGYFLWRERVDTYKILALVLSCAGCILVSGAHTQLAWQGNALGIILGLTSGLIFAGYNILGKTAIHKGMNSWTVLLYIFAFASCFLLLAQRPGTLFWLSRPLVEQQNGIRETFFGWGTLILLSLGPTIGGYGLYTASLSYLPAVTANLVVTLEPALTAAQSYLFLGERLTILQLLGSGLIISSVFLVYLSDRNNSLLTVEKSVTT